MSQAIFDQFKDPEFRKFVSTQSDIKKLLARKYLHIRGLNIRDLTGVHLFSNLENLDALGNQIESLEPLADLAGLKVVNLTDNKVADLKPISKQTRLERLSLSGNPIVDLEPLTRCPNIKELDLFDCAAIQSFEPLMRLPRLKEMSISNNSRFKDAGSLDTLISIQPKFGSMMDLPAMPNLQVIKMQCCEATDLFGIERFQNLLNLWAVGNRFADLEPLSACRKLTHIILTSNLVENLTPLAVLTELRMLAIRDNRISNISPLFALPALREVYLEKNLVNDEEIARLTNSLGSWDLEFAKPHPVYLSESIHDIRSITEEDFKYYNGKIPFNVEDFDGNGGMLGSERDWLISKIQQSLEDEGLKIKYDFHLPLQGVIRRSQTLMLSEDSEKAIKKYPQIVRHVQRVLQRMAKTWIVYLETEFDISVWVYPDHIEVKSKEQKKLKKYLK